MHSGCEHGHASCRLGALKSNSGFMLAESFLLKNTPLGARCTGTEIWWRLWYPHGPMYRSCGTSTSPNVMCKSKRNVFGTFWTNLDVVRTVLRKYDFDFFRILCSKISFFQNSSAKILFSKEPKNFQIGGNALYKLEWLVIQQSTDVLDQFHPQTIKMWILRKYMK